MHIWPAAIRRQDTGHYAGPIKDLLYFGHDIVLPQVCGLEKYDAFTRRAQQHNDQTQPHLEA
jgi:hypothetical protein